MKKVLFLLAISVGFSSCFLKKNAQTTEGNDIDPTKPVIMATFEHCKDLKDNQERTICFKEGLDRHTMKHFQYPEKAQKAGIQGRTITKLKIMADGSVRVVEVKGESEILQNEARRIMEKLPKLVPAEQEGKKVNVYYLYPITFKLNQ